MLSSKLQKSRETVEASVRSLKSSNTRRDDCVKENSRILSERETILTEKKGNLHKYQYDVVVLFFQNGFCYFFSLASDNVWMCTRVKAVQTQLAVKLQADLMVKTARAAELAARLETLRLAGHKVNTAVSCALTDCGQEERAGKTTEHPAAKPYIVVNKTTKKDIDKS